MLVKDILEHFLSRADWVDPAETVDQIIVGDGEMDVDRCAVCWIPSTRNIHRAAEMGVTLLVTHEPTFWHHWGDGAREDAGCQNKLAMINELGMTILRNHDCWDRWPDIGIPWAWARHLGLLGDDGGNVTASGGGNVTVSDDRYLLRCDIPSVTLGELAARVARACEPFGEGIVQVTGELASVVSKIGAGTGCGCDLAGYETLGCDCGIVCDDGSCYWAGIQRAEDVGFGVIRVNHGTSEEAGMITLADYITAELGVQATYLPTGCVFQLVGPDGG
ncbi:MAG: Nif3-like dinuclear metal center hexameric protein [Planctomycetota bacterium]|jgi:putative NIF3 family GTP cyclohydrolase 1 type 2